MDSCGFTGHAKHTSSSSRDSASWAEYFFGWHGRLRRCRKTVTQQFGLPELVGKDDAGPFCETDSAGVPEQFTGPGQAALYQPEPARDARKRNANKGVVLGL